MLVQKLHTTACIACTVLCMHSSGEVSVLRGSLLDWDCGNQHCLHYICPQLHFAEM